MNTFELRILESSEEPFSPHRKPRGYVTVDIWIDGQLLDEPHVVDVRQLVRSLFAPGEYFFFTCSCGTAECAGIFDGFLVRHEPGIIRWRFRRPLKQDLDELPSADGKDKPRTEPTQRVEYRFDRNQFAAALGVALNTLKSYPAHTQYSPYGFNRKELDTLDVTRRPLKWQEPPGRLELRLLADEAQPFFLDGQFVAFASLGVDTACESKYRIWKILSAPEIRCYPETRLHWLEATRDLALQAYRSGLSDTIDIIVQCHGRTEAGALDPWSVDSFAIPRRWLDEASPFAEPILCLSADAGEFCLWFDTTPEVKDSRGGFIGSGHMYDHSPFRVPLILERRLANWAGKLPARHRSRLAGSCLWKKRTESEACPDFDWASFHREGIRLTAEIQAIVGHRAIVYYEAPWESPESGRRFQAT